MNLTVENIRCMEILKKTGLAKSMELLPMVLILIFKNYFISVIFFNSKKN